MEKQVGLYEKVYDYILEQIFHQKLSYGQKVPEEEISKDLGISRTPIREALRKLESDGGNSAETVCSDCYTDGGGY